MISTFVVDQVKIAVNLRRSDFFVSTSAIIARLARVCEVYGRDRCIDSIEIRDDFLSERDLTEQLLEVTHDDRSEFVLATFIAIDQAVYVLLIGTSVIEFRHVSSRANCARFPMRERATVVCSSFLRLDRVYNLESDLLLVTRVVLDNLL